MSDGPIPRRDDDADDIAVLPQTNEIDMPEDDLLSPQGDTWPLSNARDFAEEATPVDASDAPEEDVDTDIDETEDVGSADPITRSDIPL